MNEDSADNAEFSYPSHRRDPPNKATLAYGVEDATLRRRQLDIGATAVNAAASLGYQRRVRMFNTTQSPGGNSGTSAERKTYGQVNNLMGMDGQTDMRLYLGKASTRIPVMQPVLRPYSKAYVEVALDHDARKQLEVQQASLSTQREQQNSVERVPAGPSEVVKATCPELREYMQVADEEITENRVEEMPFK